MTLPDRFAVVKPPVRVTRADAEPSPSGWFYIDTSDGERFMTKNSLVASLAHRYHVKEKLCRPISCAGWARRTLLGLEEA
jgi:hypothetical protein